MIKNLLTLGDTVELMNSKDYQDRFVAEYIQTALRYEKLKAFNTAIETAEDWMHSEDMIDYDCPRELLREQQKVMGEYLHLLEVRARIEDIDLADVIACFATRKQICCVNRKPKCEEGSNEEDIDEKENCEEGSNSEHKLEPLPSKLAELEECPLKIGDNVISVLKDENHVVELMPWVVHGIGFRDGKYYAFDESFETYEIGGPLCLPAKDILEAKERARGKGI